MDEKFQDRIDDYLLNRMNDAEKAMFLCEVEQDKEKKEQLEFTKNVKDSICSREEKLRALAQLQKQYEKERRCAALRPAGTERAVYYCHATNVAAAESVQSKNGKWLWISGVVAVLVVGFFAVEPMFMYESDPHYNAVPMEKVRGDHEVFGSTPTDSIDKDTIKINIEKKVTPDE